MLYIMCIIIIIISDAVYHKARYNTSLTSPCSDSACSHLCLIVPGGHRCTCPDTGSVHLYSSEIYCDAGIYLLYIHHLPFISCLLYNITGNKKQYNII